MSKAVWLIPVVIVVLSFAGVLGASKLSLPTLTYTYDSNFKGKSAAAKLTVDGVRCYGTANALREHIADLSGLVSLVAYGGRHRVVLEYDPEKLTVEEISSAIERPIMTLSGPMAFFKVISLELK